MTTQGPILVTGGTGSFGARFVRSALEQGDVVRVLSREEARQARLVEALGNPPNLRCALGDVRDPDRLDEAMWGVKTVVHCAAIKRMDRPAYDAEEIIKTNVLGTINVVKAAIRHGVGRVVVLSSDKACQPVNLYGVSKLAAECFAIQANSIGYPRGTKIACVRYGNVLGSRGSVVHTFRRFARRGKPLPITDPACTRFWITLDQAVAFVERALDMMGGGEVFVPKLPSVSIVELVEAVAPGHPTEVVGLRPGGEKIHEVLISEQERERALEVQVLGGESFYLLLPTHQTWGANADTSPWSRHPYRRLPEDFVYQSDRAPRLARDTLRELLAAVGDND